VTEKTPVDQEPPADERVLIVEDEVDLADMYGAYLADEYDVEVVYGGQGAIETLSDEFDVVLLDRRMPVISGNEVLAYIEEEGFELRVAMVTAVNPDFDIIDLRIDDYLVKPVSKTEMRETVRRLLKLDEYNEQMRKLTSKKLKRNVLKVEKTGAELEESEEFQRLNTEIESLESQIDEIAEDLDVDGVDSAGEW
jgi:DNA-binding response OmpR family regulator